MNRTQKDLPVPRIMRTKILEQISSKHLKSVQDITRELLNPFKSTKEVKIPVRKEKIIKEKETTKKVVSCEVFQEETKVLDSKAVNVLRNPHPRSKSKEFVSVKVSQEVVPSISNQKVSVIIGIRGTDRLQGLFHVIKSFRNQSLDSRIILVEQDTKPVCRAQVEPLVDIYLYTYSDRLYNRSWAFNCGSLLTRDEFLILHDCDLIVPKDYIQTSLRILGDKDFGFGWYQINYMTESSSISYPKGNLEFKGSFLNKQTVGGSLIIRNDFYQDIRGMDERFEGWGGEDNVFHFKACALGRLAWDGTDSGSHLIHYYHSHDNRNHNHGHINHAVIGEYYRGDRSKLREKISNLPPIGSPDRFGEFTLIDNTQRIP